MSLRTIFATYIHTPRAILQNTSKQWANNNWIRNSFVYKKILEGFIRQIVESHFPHFRRPLNTKIQTSFLITLRGGDLRQDYSVYNLCVFGHDKDEHEHCSKNDND